MFGIIRKFVFWSYSRETSQYLIFCLLIVAFIFLTPKVWFEKKEKLATRTSRLIVKASDLSGERSDLERRVRELSGNPRAEVLEMYERRDSRGEAYYVIDIK